MSENGITERVATIVCNQLDVEKDKVKPEASFINDLGADSLDIVELVMELEEEFDMSIPDEDAESIRTVGEAIEVPQKTTYWLSDPAPADVTPPSPPTSQPGALTSGLSRPSSVASAAWRRDGAATSPGSASVRSSRARSPRL